MDDPDRPPQMPQWMVDHIHQYLRSGGSEGHMWDSTAVGGPGPLPTLLLTTVGRRSGKPRALPLIYARHGEDYVVVASKGGSPAHPAWYINLRAEPNVKVQVATERFAARARTVAGDERETLWKQMVALYPPYVDYQERTQREIPIIALSRLPD